VCGSVPPGALETIEQPSVGKLFQTFYGRPEVSHNSAPAAPIERDLASGCGKIENDHNAAARGEGYAGKHIHVQDSLTLPFERDPDN
jgi:hypothetical protein